MFLEPGRLIVFPSLVSFLLVASRPLSTVAGRGDNKSGGCSLTSALKDLYLPVGLISLAIQRAAEDKEGLKNVTDLKNDKEDKVLFSFGQPWRQMV